MHLLCMKVMLLRVAEDSGQQILEFSFCGIVDQACGFLVKDGAEVLLFFLR